MLGNMQRESWINPGVWQNFNEGAMHVGFGLVQWTPASNLITWANIQSLPYANMDTQLLRILYELQHDLQYYQTSDYPLSFLEYTQSSNDPEWLASAFLKNYERAGAEAEQDRRVNARYWFDNLDWSGQGGGGGGGEDGEVIASDLYTLLLCGALNGWNY